MRLEVRIELELPREIRIEVSADPHEQFEVGRATRGLPIMEFNDRPGAVAITTSGRSM
ncbi:MAG: hypothetical protein R3E96_01260 [Planctomycetota bacterium]